MSAPQEEEDLAPTLTPGYKPGAQKTVEELAELDAQDESLARWKASLGIVPGTAGGAASGPQVTVLGLELKSETMPKGKMLVMRLKGVKEIPGTFTIKEGVPYSVNVVFKVNHGIVSGVHYIQAAKKGGITLDKMDQMLGSYGPNTPDPNQPYIKSFGETSPSGLIYRTGTFNVKSRIMDDDRYVHAEWTWTLKFAKEWAVDELVDDAPGSWS